MFVFEIEWEILFGNNDKQDNFMHPFIALPFIGQILLIISLFQSTPNRKLVVVGIILTGLVALLLVLIGILVQNEAMMCAPLPFIGLSVFYFIFTKNKSI